MAHLPVPHHQGKKRKEIHFGAGRACPPLSHCPPHHIPPPGHPSPSGADAPTLVSLKNAKPQLPSVRIYRPLGETTTKRGVCREWVAAGTRGDGI